MQVSVICFLKNSASFGESTKKTVCIVYEIYGCTTNLFYAFPISKPCILRFMSANETRVIITEILIFLKVFI